MILSLGIYKTDIHIFHCICSLTWNLYIVLSSELAATCRYLYIDCTSNGLSKRPAVPIFNGTRICLQAINQCQQVYSAAAIGAIEARFTEDDQVF